MSEKSALVVVDTLNGYDHPDADKLTESVAETIEPIRMLIHRAEDEGVEVIYVNDNYGDWNSSAEELAQNALKGKRPDLVEPILPPDDADFVIKARHTIFYGTPLEYLLGEREIGHLVLTGQVTEHASSRARSTRMCAASRSPCRATRWPASTRTWRRLRSR